MEENIVGFIIKISYCYEWDVTYVIKSNMRFVSEDEAKEIAYNRFKSEANLVLPETISEATNDDSFNCEVLGEFDDIILV